MNQENEEIVNVSVPVLRSTIERLKEITAEDTTKRALGAAITYRITHECQRVKVVA